jgi:hypothetical protein
MRLKPTRTTIGLMGGALALVVLATGGLLWVQNNALTETLRQVEAKEAEVQDGQRRERRREEALSTLEADREQLRFLESGVSDAAYVPTLLKQIEELAVQTNNRVLGVQPQRVQEAPNRLQQRRDPEAQASGEGGADDKEKPQKAEPYTPLGIQITLVGGYRSTQAFIERLTQFPKIVAVEEMQLRPHRGGPSEKDASALLDVEINLVAFVMKAKPQPRRSEAGTVSASAAVGGSQ